MQLPRLITKRAKPDPEPDRVRHHAAFVARALRLAQQQRSVSTAAHDLQHGSRPGVRELGPRCAHIQPFLLKQVATIELQRL